MKKRPRSRVLPVGMLSASAFALLAAGLLFYPPTSSARAQDKPSAVELLDRGARLFDQGQFPEAKAVLKDIDRGQLPEDQRVAYDKLLLQTDTALSKSVPSNTTFDNAESALKNDHLAQASKLYKIVIDSPNAPADLRDKARQQLAVVQQKQHDRAPAMKQLLKQAVAAYDAGNYDESANALYTVQITGSDLGWSDNAKPAKYMQLIADKRLALANAPKTPAPAAATPTLATNTKPTQTVVVAAPAEKPATQKPTVVAAAPAEKPPAFSSAGPATQVDNTKPVATTTVVVATPKPEPKPEPKPTAVAVAAPDKNTTITTNVAVAPTTVVAPVESAVAPAPVPTTAPVDNRARSMSLTAQGDNELKNARYQDAISHYDQALQLDPDNDAARLGRTRAEQESGQGGRDTLSAELDRVRIQHERAVVAYNENLRQSSDALARRDFTAAQDRARDALAAVESSRIYFPQSEYDAKIAAARAQMEQIAAQQAIAAQNDNAERARQAKITEDALARRIKEQREIRVNELMARAETLTKDMQLEQAADVLHQIIAIDPQNNSAKYMLTLVLDKIEYRTFAKHTDSRTRAEMADRVEGEEKLIPFEDLMIYPEDWVELSRRRGNDLTANESDVDRKTREKLNQDIPQITIDNKPFDKVIASLMDITGVSISVNWKALTDGGLERTTPITLNYRDVKFKKVLQDVLAQVSGANATLGYYIDEGIVTISTSEKINTQTVIRVYDIRDLLFRPRELQLSSPNTLSTGTSNANSQTSGTTSGGAAGGGGGGLFQGGGQSNGSSSSSSGTTTITQKSRDDLVKELLKVVSSTVAPDSWRTIGEDTGPGSVGSIRELNGQLIVSQTSDSQLAVFNLLQQLREQSAVQISIEARFLLVSNNFLDDFGFNWGLTFPAGFFGGSTGDFTITNNTGILTAPSTTGVPGSLAGGSPSLNITGSILDGYQLSLLLRASQQDKRSTTLTAPRVTLISGQVGVLQVGSQINYVASSTSTNTTGVAVNGANTQNTTTLVPQTLNLGVTLQVGATVSADRRYVLLNLAPQITSLDGIDTFLQQGGSGTTTQANTSGSTSQTGATNTIFTAPPAIQLPKISVTSIETSVSVPDGGTLLIGGQKVVGENEIEAGVPILSKIPGINRLFTNRSYIRDERTLFILVRPKIIIQKEIEQEKFGTSNF